ncbi:ABC transporter permease [Nocardioides sp. J54]|uniref:ABC transporter permease n=1 Tax=Nocardioides sp. J54 TaxID=935866 RepID=UPI00048A7DFA|nr:ABC transporter permease [Nocardioides sp. J54]
MTKLDDPPTAAGTKDVAGRREGRNWRNLSRLLTPERIEDLALLCVLVALGAYFSARSPYFLYADNLSNLLLAVSVIGTMAAISTLVLVAGYLDLSVGSAAAFSAIACVWLIEDHGWGTAAAILTALLLGTVVGSLNGVFSVALGVNPIITTIGMLSVLRGLAYVMTEGSEILVNDEFLLDLGSGRFLSLPYGVWVMFVTFVLVALFARYTVAGRNLYAIGANPRASRLAGIAIGRYQVVVLAASGLSAAVGGLLLISQAGSAASHAATGYELQVVTAVLLGGTALTGGSGRIRGTFLAVLIIGTLNNGMTLLAVPSYYQTVASGVLLLAAVGVAQARQRLRRSGATK